jgi:molecular chaperone DnaK (HSP70)
MPAQYAIGIDLGTTNSVLAYAKLGEEHPKVELLPIPQLVAPSTVESRNVLPSFLYLGTEQETSAGAFDLPWKKSQPYATGAMAVKQAADVPTRSVVAAKSWLAYTKVDRHQPILPWNAPADVAKVSPVDASRRYLEHLVAAWTAAFPKAPIAKQQVVLTVPASFDASARELTREAALLAGLPENLVLLEEPQAAQYAWLADTGDKWRRQLKLNDTILVCDIGGGTTDFTLIGVVEEQGELTLQRIAVGNHTLVGGDNMDLALAHFATSAFKEKGVDLNPWQSVALWHSCRTAKEALLSPNGPDKHPLTVLGRGSKLIGGTVSVDLHRDTVRRLLVDGFFPLCDLSAKPERRRVSGFREIGLPFEADTAITRHLAAFLSAQAAAGTATRPTHVLLNGGVFKAAAFAEQLTKVMEEWFGRGVDLLSGHPDLDYAVARGAAYYGAIKSSGRGIRIRGGTARSYYVGIETSGPAIPGAPRPLKALCVVPFGMEEGTAVDVPSEEIGLVVGESAVFRFFSSNVRKQDQPGNLLGSWSESELEETDSLEAKLPEAQNIDEDYVPVKFRSAINELGVFELWCVSTVADQRWKLEFSVREDAEAT